MKARHTILLFLTMFLVFGTGPKILAQQSKDELAKEIEKERKMEAKAAQEAELRARKEMLEQQKAEMRNQEMDYAEQVREAYRISGVAEVEPVTRVAPFYFQETQTQLTLRNSFRGGTDSSKGVFDVDSGTRYFRCMINGKVNSGEIYIKVSYPGGKVFKELTINSSAEINFSQSLNIKEGEENKYLGSWQYEVKADKAEGNYMLQISYN